MKTKYEINVFLKKYTFCFYDLLKNDLEKNLDDKLKGHLARLELKPSLTCCLFQFNKILKCLLVRF